MSWQPIDADLMPGAENLDGVWWFDAPLPRRWHRCKAQTRGVLDGRAVERCACGASRVEGRSWFERNSSRRSR